jgi:hypothetical protein
VLGPLICRAPESQRVRKSGINWRLIDNLHLLVTRQGLCGAAHFATNLAVRRARQLELRLGNRSLNSTSAQVARRVRVIRRPRVCSESAAGFSRSATLWADIALILTQEHQFEVRRGQCSRRLRCADLCNDGGRMVRYRGLAQNCGPLWLVGLRLASGAARVCGVHHRAVVNCTRHRRLSSHYV